MADTTTRAKGPTTAAPAAQNQRRALRLSVRFTLCRLGMPLACVDGLPGDGAELRAEDLRVLAQALQHAADECTLQHCRTAHRYGGRLARSVFPREDATTSGRAAV